MGFLLGFALGEIQAYSAHDLLLKANMDRIVKAEADTKLTKDDVENLLLAFKKIPEQGFVPEKAITLHFGEEYDLQTKGKKIVSTKNPKTVYIQEQFFNQEPKKFYLFPLDDSNSGKDCFTLVGGKLWRLEKISGDEFTLVEFSFLNDVIEKIRTDNWVNSIEYRYKEK